jgi:hypothetical protein
LTHQSSSGILPLFFSNAARDSSYLTCSFGEYELIANSKKVKKTQNDAQKIASYFAFDERPEGERKPGVRQRQELRFFGPPKFGSVKTRQKKPRILREKRHCCFPELVEARKSRGKRPRDC